MRHACLIAALLLAITPSVTMIGVSSPLAAECCSICKKGQPWGDSCISRKKTCHKPPGCACSLDQSSFLPFAIAPAADAWAFASRPDWEVVDGDTFRLNGESIRLEGIDAPELEQICNRTDGTPYACGVRAAAALKRILKAGAVICASDGKDRYGRVLAHCRAGATEVNRAMVARGWAWAFLRYSREFVVEEQQARSKRIGVWSGTADAPWDWRKTH